MVKGEKDNPEGTVKCHPTHEKAKVHMAALYANEPEAAVGETAETTTWKGVPILRTGTWHGLYGTFSYNEDDLDELVEAHNALLESGQGYVKVSLTGGVKRKLAGIATIGHNKHDRDGNVIQEAPVIGKLAHMYRKGAQLFIDIAEVPKNLAATIAKAYPDRSVEGAKFHIKKGVEIAGKKYRQVITSVALLGENLPAVEGLEDLPMVLNETGAGEIVLVFFQDDGGGGGLEYGSEYLNQAVRAATKRLWKVKDDDARGSLWVRDVYDDHGIVEFDGKLWSVPFVVLDGEVTLGKPVEVRTEYVPVAGAEADGEIDTQAEIEEIMAALDLLQGRVNRLTRGRNGNPIINARFRALRERIRGTVKLQKETDMDLSEVRTLLSLDEAADGKAIVVALASASGDQDTIAKLVALADGLEFNDANQFVAWLAGKLDVSPGNLTAIADAVAQALGLDATEEDQSALPNEEPTMSKNDKTKGGRTTGALGRPGAGQSVANADGAESIVAQLQADLAEQQQTVTDLLQWKVRTVGEQATHQAESLVDGAIAAGKFVPAQRETLVALATHDAVAFTQLAESQPTIVKFGERGHGGSPDEASISLTETDRVVSRALGISEDAFRKQKAADQVATREA